MLVSGMVDMLDWLDCRYSGSGCWE